MFFSEQARKPSAFCIVWQQVALNLSRGQQALKNALQPNWCVGALVCSRCEAGGLRPILRLQPLFHPRSERFRLAGEPPLHNFLDQWPPFAGLEGESNGFGRLLELGFEKGVCLHELYFHERCPTKEPARHEILGSNEGSPSVRFHEIPKT